MSLTAFMAGELGNKVRCGPEAVDAGTWSQTGSGAGRFTRLSSMLGFSKTIDIMAPLRRPDRRSRPDDRLIG